MRVVTAVGDAEDVATWSGIPAFFVRAGKAAGFFDAGLPLDPERLRVNRAVWNAVMFATTGKRGGYQYTDRFLRRLWSQVKLPSELDVVSHFPLLPPRPWKPTWSVSYYMDATLKQNFDEYGVSGRVHPRVQRDTLERERQNYMDARFLVAMSRWPARSLVEDYGIDPTRIHVIRPGANLDVPAELPERAALEVRPGRPVRLGFIGKDWRRKGLPALLDAAELIASDGVPVEVQAIGPRPEDLPSHPLLRPLGFVDKHRDLPRFVRLVTEFDFGCLLSRVEALGISTLECLALGVPALGTRVGGIVDCIPEGTGKLVELDDAPRQVAAFVLDCVRKPERYDALRARVLAQRSEFTWDATVRNFQAVWSGSDAFQYAKVRASA